MENWMPPMDGVSDSPSGGARVLAGYEVKTAA